MIRQAFRKPVTFMEFATALSIPTEVTRRPKVNTAIPRVVKRRRNPHGKMRLFKSYRIAGRVSSMY